jgi:hypothetical protein
MACLAAGLFRPRQHLIWPLLIWALPDPLPLQWNEVFGRIFYEAGASFFERRKRIEPHHA